MKIPNEFKNKTTTKIGSINKTVENIIKYNKSLEKFWTNIGGWVPEENLKLLKKSRLDWQIDLSFTLKLWIEYEMTDGHLILAWVNLGILIEGSLKLFLSVYLHQYENNNNKYRLKKNTTKPPDILKFEQLKQFFTKEKILPYEQLKYIEKIQDRRNAVHAFKSREIGKTDDFFKCVEEYLELLIELDKRLPYPDGYRFIGFSPLSCGL